MLKEPRPGRVKTRLGRDIGMVPAAWWFRHLCRALLRRLNSPKWHLLLAISPDRAINSRIWPAHLRRIAQGPGNLGQRMARLFRHLPPGPVVIIGADIPGITPRHITNAFTVLGNHDAVIGPAPDGGYWLIGLKRSKPPPASLFHNVRWSSPHALADTCASLPSAKIALINTLQDIDTAADLATLKSE